MRPPLEKHGFADELEPWRELQSVILEKFLETVFGDVLRSLHFVLVDVKVNVGLDEKNVVNCGQLVSNPRLRYSSSPSMFCRRTLMLAPLSVAWSLIMDTGQEVEILDGDLLLLDTQLVVKFALSSSLDAHDRVW